MFSFRKRSLRRVHRDWFRWGGDETPVVYIRPVDSKGREYYIDENGQQKNVSYKRWEDCANDFNDADKCSKIVTDKCQSCMGACQAKPESERKIQLGNGFSISGVACSQICLADCSTGDGTVDPAVPGRDDENDFGKFYYENGVKKYSNFHDFHSCYVYMDDVEYCVSKYGYGCSYGLTFYVTNMCSAATKFGYSPECTDPIRADYNAACNK